MVLFFSLYFFLLDFNLNLLKKFIFDFILLFSYKYLILVSLD